MATGTGRDLDDAKERLDRLLANARSQGLMPITIAEALNKIREGEASLDNPDNIRRRSYHWLSAINHRLFGKATSLNRSYWDKLYSDHMPLPALSSLADENNRRSGIVEAYVYARLRQTVDTLRPVRHMLTPDYAGDFSLSDFLAVFETEARLRRSIDKAYEIVVHALFNAIAARVRAQVTVSVDTTQDEILADFKDFCRLLLGVDDENPSVTVPARLYRVGTANSRDGGVDMWANFGPAIQVKHISLDPNHIEPIVDGLSADQVVIVCKAADRSAIEAVLTQVGLIDHVRGIVTQSDLTHWYDLALGPKHATSMAEPLFKALLAEFDYEFTLADPGPIDKFAAERGYDKVNLADLWAVDEPLVRRKKTRRRG